MSQMASISLQPFKRPLGRSGQFSCVAEKERSSRLDRHGEVEEVPKPNRLPTDNVASGGNGRELNFVVMTNEQPRRVGSIALTR